MFRYVRSYSFGDSITHVGHPGEMTGDDDGNMFMHDGVTAGGTILPRTMNKVLTRAMLLACHTTPVEIIPAPGVGKAIALFCVATSSRVVSMFTGGANAGLAYATDGSVSYTITNDLTTTIGNGRNSFTVSDLTSPSAAASYKMDNASVVFTASANFSGGSGSSAVVTVVYTIMPLADNGAGDF